MSWCHINTAGKPVEEGKDQRTQQAVREALEMIAKMIIVLSDNDSLSRAEGRSYCCIYLYRVMQFKGEAPGTRGDAAASLDT